MSRGYRVRQTVRVSDSLQRDVHARDSISTELELLEILPCDQMSELLTQELIGRGFERRDDGTLIRVQDGVTITIDPETSEVVIGMESTETASIQGSRAESVDTNAVTSTKARLAAALREELESRVGEVEEQALRKVSGKLEAAISEITHELDQVVNRVTANALKQKASQLGQIKEMSEDPETGSLTIKVEV